MIDWEGIVSRDGPAVWRTAYRLLGNRADADECFQETFVAALSFSKRAAVNSWPALLHRLATARAVDRLRQRQRRFRFEQTTEFEMTSGTEPQPSQNAEAGELSVALREALSHLPERQAEVFCLHALEGWSHDAIARQMEVSTEAIAVLLHRARARLKELLARSIMKEKRKVPT